MRFHKFSTAAAAFVTALHVSAQASFPPESWLGYGLNLAAITPADIQAVTKSVLKFWPIVALDGKSQPVVYGNITYEVPINVDFETDTATGESSYVTYSNGDSAAQAFEASASLSAEYLGLALSDSADYSIQKAFNSNWQYAMFAYNKVDWSVQIKTMGPYIQVGTLYNAVTGLPTWDPSNASSVDSYASFFGAYGTHVITGCTYGNRFQLISWANNSDSSVTQNWGDDINAVYNGLTNNGTFNASIKDTTQYSTFYNSMQKTVSVQGGDVNLAADLTTAPENSTVYTNYQAWVKSTTGTPDVMSMQYANIWDVMTASANGTLEKWSPVIEQAFEWIVSNPAPHHTNCSFNVNSDWGSFDLLTPGAQIIQAIPPITDFTNLIFSPTKIQWGQPSSHNFGTPVTFQFVIVNDGSPVDFALSHGSDSSLALGGGGSSSAEIYQANYANTQKWDGHYNTQWFYQAPVNPNKFTG